MGDAEESFPTTSKKLSKRTKEKKTKKSSSRMKGKLNSSNSLEEEQTRTGGSKGRCGGLIRDRNNGSYSREKASEFEFESDSESEYAIDSIAASPDSPSTRVQLVQSQARVLAPLPPSPADEGGGDDNGDYGPQRRGLRGFEDDFKDQNDN